MHVAQPVAGAHVLPQLLFAYGTLGPADPAALGWEPDRVRGRLFDLGPYPGLVGWDDPGSGWVEGHVRAVSQHELETLLDPYEDVDGGLFRRLALMTERGRAVWVYVFARPVPAGARGPLTRWDGRRLTSVPHGAQAPAPAPEC